MFRPSLIGWLGAALIVSASAIAAPAKKPAPQAAKAKAPAQAPARKTPTPTPAPAPEIELNPGQLEAAGRVMTGAIACEFGQDIRVMPVDGKPGYFTLVVKKTTYTLVPQETTTGAVRLEDRGAGIVWLQIPAKSMLLNTRNGSRLLDSCLHEEQRLAAAQPGSALGIVQGAPTAGALPGVTAALSGAALQAPLIPRQVLFGPVLRSGGSISPDGQWLAWIAPREGVPNVWVAPAAAPDDARPVTDDRQRGIQGYSFARDGRHLLYTSGEGGDGNRQVFAVDLASGGARALSPEGSRGAIAGLSDTLTGEVLLSVNDRDPSQFDLVRVVIATGERTRVLTDDGFTRRLLGGAPAYADADGSMVHPVTGIVQASRSRELPRRWVATDPAISADLQRLETLADGAEFTVTARTRSDDIWVVTVNRPDAAAKTYLYDRSGAKTGGNARLWFDSRPAWAGLPLAPVRALEIPTRAGAPIPASLTLPPGTKADAAGRPERPLPMVLLLHGGQQPNTDGVNETRQWLANRGYAVLGMGIGIGIGSRGPEAFDKTAAGAGSVPWDRAAHERLLDAVAWAVAGGIAQRDKVALMGGVDIDGGYASLASLATAPKDFACGVAYVGPGNLAGLLETVPGGSARLDAPRNDTLASALPMERPLLVGQGASGVGLEPPGIDGRGDASHDERSVERVRAVRARGIAPTYVRFPDEGNRIVRPANRISFNAVAEQFLATCLGGRAEPVGDDFKDASIRQAPMAADELRTVKAPQ